MPSVYLQPQDYATYGLDPATTTDFLINASMRVNAYLMRPEGLLYKNDGNGNPCYMDGMIGTELTITSGAVTPGNHVTVTVDRIPNDLQTGSVLILDRAIPSATEAVIAESITGNSIQLKKVQFSHDANALMEYSLTIVEEAYVPSKRWIVQLAQTPVKVVLSALGILGYPRRSDQYKMDYNWQLLPLITEFGGVPVWQSFDVLPDSLSELTGALWLSPALYLMLFTQIKAYYIAGWTYATLPPQIKMATANIAKNLSQGFTNQFGGGIGMVKQGDTTVKAFANTQIDGDTQVLLKPYLSHQFI